MASTKPLTPEELLNKKNYTPKYSADNTSYSLSAKLREQEEEEKKKKALENLYTVSQKAAGIVQEKSSSPAFDPIQQNALDQFIKNKGLTTDSLKGQVAPTAQLPKFENPLDYARAQTKLDEEKKKAALGVVLPELNQIQPTQNAIIPQTQPQSVEEKFGVKEKISDPLLYTAMTFGAGVASTPQTVTSGVSTMVSDLFNGGKTSDDFKKIEGYFAANPNAENLGRTSLEIINSKPGAMDLVIAGQIGVSPESLKLYRESKQPEMVKAFIDESVGATTPEWYKSKLGKTIYSAGAQIIPMMYTMGMSAGGAGASKSFLEVLSGGGKVSTALKALVKPSATTALTGISAAGSKYNQLAKEYGSNPLNVVNAIATGYGEALTENLGGFTDAKSFVNLFSGKNAGANLLKYLASSAEEFLEEAANVPLEGIIDKATVDPNKAIIGKGGVFDLEQMIDSGVQGFLVGALMGGPAYIASTVSTAVETGKIKEGVQTLTGIAKTSLPEDLRPEPINYKTATEKDLAAYADEVNNAIESYKQTVIEEAEKPQNQEASNTRPVTLPDGRTVLVDENNKLVTPENGAQTASPEAQEVAPAETENAPAASTEAESYQPEKITPDMDDKTRAQILNKTTLMVAGIDQNAINNSGEDLSNLSKKTLSQARTSIRNALSNIKGFKAYSNPKVDINFEFSRSDFPESAHKQTERKGSTGDFKNMLLSLDDIVKNAVILDAHGDRYAGTYRQDNNLDSMIVMVSAYRDGKFIVPVELSIKKQRNTKTGNLYMAVTLKKIEAGIVPTHGSGNSTDGTVGPPTSVISIADLIKNVNTIDEDFLYYVPDSMLNAKQIAAKRRSQKRHSRKLEHIKMDTDPKTLRKSPVQTEENGKVITWSDVLKDSVENPAVAFEEKWGIKTRVMKPNVKTNAGAFLQNGVVVLNANNIDTYSGAVAKIVHEAAHIVENSKYWDAMKSAALEYYRLVNPDLTQNQLREIARARYNGVTELNDKGADGEIVAGFLESICGENQYIADRAVQLLLEKPNLFNRIRNFFADKVRYLKAKKNLSTSEKHELAAARRALNNLARGLKSVQDGKANILTGTEFSYGEDSFTDYALKYLAKKYGEMPKGEIPSRDVVIPLKTSEKLNVRRGARTIIEAGSVSDEMAERLKEEVAKEALSYQTISDKSAEKYADEMIESRGIGGALDRWDAVVNGDERPTKNTLVLGEKLMLEAGKAGDVDTFLKLAAEVSAEATRAGQTVQAMHLIKRMTPEGRLYYVEKAISAKQKDLNKKYGKKATQLNLPKELGENLLKAETQDQIDAAEEAILAEVAKQMPSTWRDKWDAWRYMSMLFNPRTHIRNVLGNAVFVPTRSLKNAAAYLLDKTVTQENRTVAFLTKKDKALRNFAENNFKEVSDVLTSGGKMNPSTRLDDLRKIFTSKVFAWLEWLRVFNNKLLEKEDMFFLRRAYVNSFAKAMKARGLTAEFLSSDSVEARTALNRVQQLATKEALEATYRDASEFAKTLNRFKEGKVGYLVGNALFPFTKTPVNILKRGVEYSPVSIIKGIVDVTYSVRKGKKTAAEAINDWSKGLTGLGVVAFGYLLSHLGILVAGGSEDPDERGFETLQGAKTYSLKIGDVYYTIDWIAPTSLPLFVGAEMHKTFTDGREISFKSVMDSMSRISEPMFNLSMLDGLNDAIQSIAYTEDGRYLENFAVTAVVDYITQGLPTLGGQIARTIDPKARNSYYIDKNSWAPEAVQEFLNTAQAKLPGLSFLLSPSVDAWGRETGEENAALRAFTNFISPGYYSVRNETPVDKEIAKVYEATGEKSVLPEKPGKTITVDKEKRNLTAAQYTQLTQENGQRAYNYINQLMGTDFYDSLSPDEKAEQISKMYSLAAAEARKEVMPEYEIPKTVSKMYEASEKGVLFGFLETKENADTDGNSYLNGDETRTYLDKLNIPRDKKALVFSLTNPKAKNNPYD